MNIENNIVSTIEVIKFFNKTILDNELIKKLREHSAYPSLLSYFEVFDNFEIAIYPIKISENQLNLLEYPLMALIFDEHHGNNLTFINKIGDNYQIFKNNKTIEIDENTLKKYWLGFAFLFNDEIDQSINLEDISLENKINFEDNHIFGNAIGMRNKFTNNAFNYNINFDIIGNDNEIIIDKNTDIHDLRIKIRGNKNRLTIAQNCRLSGVFLLEHGNSQINISDNTTIEFAEISASESNTSVNIGKNCMLSSGIIINTSDSHSIIDKNTAKRINYAKNIKLHDNVWLARNVMILKGVTIESKSIVGAGSVLTKNVPSNSIFAGNPAKLIKDNITWDRELISITL